MAATRGSIKWPDLEITQTGKIENFEESKNKKRWKGRPRDMTIKQATPWPETDAGGEINIDRPRESSGEASGAELWPISPNTGPNTWSFGSGFLPCPPAPCPPRLGASRRRPQVVRLRQVRQVGRSRQGNNWKKFGVLLGYFWGTFPVTFRGAQNVELSAPVGVPPHGGDNPPYGGWPPPNGGGHHPRGCGHPQWGWPPP